MICLNTQTNVLEIACANNPIWILRAPKESVIGEKATELVEVKPDKQPIGYASSHQIDFTYQSIALEKGV